MFFYKVVPDQPVEREIAKPEPDMSGFRNKVETLAVLVQHFFRGFASRDVENGAQHAWRLSVFSVLNLPREFDPRPGLVLAQDAALKEKPRASIEGSRHRAHIRPLVIRVQYVIFKLGLGQGAIFLGPTEHLVTAIVVPNGRVFFRRPVPNAKLGGASGQSQFFFGLDNRFARLDLAGDIPEITDRAVPSFGQHDPVNLPLVDLTHLAIPAFPGVLGNKRMTLRFQECVGTA